nr:hypothetical protein Itr_chr12CG15330 [Ipomoea trifida]
MHDRMLKANREPVLVNLNVLSCHQRNVEMKESFRNPSLMTHPALVETSTNCNHGQIKDDTETIMEDVRAVGTSLGELHEKVNISINGISTLRCYCDDPNDAKRGK